MREVSVSPIIKKDSSKQMVWLEVYTPNVPDSQGDFATPEEIEKMCYGFMRKQRMYNIDTEHNLQKNGSVVVENFIARPGDPDFNEGAWVQGIHVPDKEVWALVEKGELNGGSMYGSGFREETVIEIEIPDDGIVKGDTLEAEDHKHEVFLKFDETGALVEGWTSEVNSHKHQIKRGTITENASGHMHRYSMTDALANLIKSGAYCPPSKKAKKDTMKETA